jgi:hypothetical protein
MGHSTKCFIIPNEAKTLKLGQKRKPGRPARTVLALARQPSEMRSILDEDADDEDTDQTPVPTNSLVEPITTLDNQSQLEDIIPQSMSQNSVPFVLPTMDSLFTEPNIENETFFVNLMTNQTFLTPDNSRDSILQPFVNQQEEPSLLLIGRRAPAPVEVAQNAVVSAVASIPVVTRKRKERSDKGKTRKPK